jgi:hypothetical protein
MDTAHDAATVTVSLKSTPLRDEQNLVQAVITNDYRAGGEVRPCCGGSEKCRGQLPIGFRRASSELFEVAK